MFGGLGAEQSSGVVWVSRFLTVEGGFPAALGSYCRELPGPRAGCPPLSVGLEEGRDVCPLDSYPARLLHSDSVILTTILK